MPGDVVLVRLSGVGGASVKLRPALILANLPGPHQDLLICGIGTQLSNVIPDWDDLIDTPDADFPGSGLRQASVIRLSYLQAVGNSDITGTIGFVDVARLDKLLRRLADHLHP